MENAEAKEEQSAFKSPLDCSLQVDAKIFQVDMYRFGDIHLRDYPLNFRKEFPAFRPQDSETVVARKKNKTKHSVKNGRKLIELLIYSLYFDAISYHDQLFLGYC